MIFDASPTHRLRLGLATLVLVTLAGAGCQAPPPAMEVGEIGFSQEELRGLGDERIDDLVRISSLALSLQADDLAGLGQPILDRRIRGWQVDRLRDALILEAASVTEEELEARYDAAPEWELEVRHLVVMVEPWEPEAEHREARASAEAALDEIREGAAFEEVAGRVSDEPGAARRGGLLSPGRLGTWVTPFWEAALALEVGEVSEVVETEYGYHVLTLEARHPVPFHEARTRLMRQVAAELGGGAAWEAHREALASQLEVDSGGARAGGIQVSAESLERHLASLPARDRQGLEGAPGEVRALLEDAALHLVLAEEADLRGIEAAEEDVAALLRQWEREAGAWASFLGLGGPSGSGEELAAACLEALRSTDQNARIARREMAEIHPVLLAGWPVRRPGDEEATHHPPRIPLPDLTPEG